MNAANLWAGHEYAWIPSRGRGQTFSHNARRVRLTKINKRREYGNTNATTYAHFEILDWDGNGNIQPDMSFAPAREIIDFWDNYYNEHEDTLSRALERKREEARQAKRRQMEDAAIRQALVSRGLDDDAISVGYGSSVSIQRKAILQWLGISEIKLSEVNT